MAMQARKRIPVSVTSRGQMTIPSEVRDALGIDTPDRIFIVLEGNQARIEHDALTVDTIMGSFPRRADQPYLGSREEVDEAMEEAAEALGPRREPS